MNKQELVKTFQANKKEIARISAITRNTNEESFEKIELIKDKSRSKIRMEEKITYEAVKIINEEISKEENKAKEEILILNEPIEKIKEIVKFLKIDLSQDINIIPESRNRHGREKDDELLGTFFEDDFMKLDIAITENGYGYRVNKYSLECSGKTKFIEIIKDKCNHRKFYDWGCNFEIEGRRDIAIKIKPFQTKQAAKNYYKARKGKILSEILKVHEEIKEKYNTYHKEYSLSDFEDLSKPFYVENAELIFKEISSEKEYCLLNGCWYSTSEEKETNIDNASKFIEFQGKIYEYLCAKNELKIFVKGNLTFGRWLNVSIQPHKHGVTFNKDNLKKEIEICKKRVENSDRETKTLTFPKIKWYKETF